MNLKLLRKIPEKQTLFDLKEVEDMNKEMYEVCNRIHTDFGEYEEEKLSEVEMKKNRKRVMDKISSDELIQNRKQSSVLKKVAVAALIIVISGASATTMSFASSGKVLPFIYTFFNGSGITESQNEETGESSTTIEMNASVNPPVVLEDGRLYYTMDGSKTDITNLISETKAYIGEVKDSQGNTHIFIIGGWPEAQSYGYEENIFNQNGEFIGASGYYGSKVEGIGDEVEPVWLEEGRKQIR